MDVVLATVHLYLLTLNALTNSLDNFEKVLNCEDKQRWQKFKSRKRAKQLIASRLIILHHLKHVEGLTINNDYLILQYKRLNFLNNKFSISVSHSKNLVAVAIVNADIDLGLDAEVIKKRDVAPLLAQYALDSEANFILNSDNVLESFYGIWTLKEAYIKRTNATFTQAQQLDMSSWQHGQLISGNYIYQTTYEECFLSLLVQADTLGSPSIEITRLIESDIDL